MELQRIDELRNYRVLDTLSEKEFDSITQIVSHICDAPISLITLIDKDRQWFKSKFIDDGFEFKPLIKDLQETPRSISFCTHTIQEEEDYMVVNDLTKDERFINNPFVTNVPYAKFYAGVSLRTPAGFKLGTVCVLDDKPRELDDKQMACLRAMSDYTISLLETRRKNRELEVSQAALKEVNEELVQYAHAVAHDIKSPLRIMSSFSTFLKKTAKDKLNERETEYLDFIVSGANELSTYTQKLLEFAQETNINVDNSTDVNLNVLMDSLNVLLNQDKKVSILYDNDLPTIFTSRIGVQQILQNLISNSIRYLNPEIPSPYVGIEIMEDEDYYFFEVLDNGLGIKKERLKEVFQLFSKDENKVASTGIGLNLVQRLVKKMNGNLSIESEEGRGTTIKFSIEKIIK